MICSVYRQRRRVNGEIVVAESWSGRLRMPWETKVSTIALNTADKRIALHKLFLLREEREKEHNGLIAPKSVRDAASLPLSTLLDDYLVGLESRGRTPNTLKKYRDTLRKLFDRCRWTLIQHVTNRSFTLWRNHCGLSGKTVNDLLAAACTFFDWLESQGMLHENPLKRVDRVDTRGREQYRRALNQDEIQRLLDAAPPSRAVIYLTALYTGLRRNELNQLRWGDLHLEHAQPFVCARPSTTKNKKEARIPLRPDVVEALRSIRSPDAAPFQYVFNRRIPRVRTFRKDLTKAGVAFIDNSGRRMDFHALRVTLGTLLAKNRVPLNNAMRYMRHSDPRQTAVIYTDASHLELLEASNSLPAMNLHHPNQMLAT